MRLTTKGTGFAPAYGGQWTTGVLMTLLLAAALLAAPARETAPETAPQTAQTAPQTAKTAPQTAQAPDLELMADFNRDGYHDLAVGVPGETFANGAEGAVHVIYGGPDGLDGDNPVDDQVWAQDSVGIGESAQQGDNFGYTLAWGDFNGDGYHDLAVGVPYETLYDTTSLPTVPEAGVIHVIYGSPTGLTAVGNIVLTQNSSGIADQAEPYDYFGWALAAGNFGYGPETDLAVAAPGEDLNAEDAGAVNVLFGSPAGLGATGNQFWHQDSVGISGVGERTDFFGIALAAANFGNGGYADLAVGVPYEDLDPATEQNAGVVNVIYGSTVGLTATGNSMWHQNRTGIGGVVEAGDLFGFSLAAANFGDSGESDLAIGVPLEDVNDPDAGAVNVIYGSAAGLAETGNQLWHTALLNMSGQTETNFGTALVAANFGNGGYADLAVGVPYINDAAGAVIVFYGSSSGLIESGWDYWSQSGDVNGDPEDNDMFGRSLAAANFGKGSEADLAVGVPGEDYERLFLDDLNVGAVNIIYGSSSGLTTTGNQFWWQRSDALHDSGSAWDYFGASLA